MASPRRDGGAVAMSLLPVPRSLLVRAVRPSWRGAVAWPLLVVGTAAAVAPLAWALGQGVAFAPWTVVALPGLALAGWAGWRLQRLQRDLGRLARQLGSSPTGGEDAGFSRPAPELSELAQAAAQLRQRLERLAEAQAGQVEQLRCQVHQDAVTGLSNRRHLLASLSGVLEGDEAPTVATLLLVRLHDLAALNQRLGREATDRLLRALALCLQSYPQHVPGCLLGRLDGSDFVLLLPVGGVAADTAQALRLAMRHSLATVEPGARVSVAALEWRPPGCAEVALAALAQALEAEVGVLADVAADVAAVVGADVGAAPGAAPSAGSRLPGHVQDDADEAPDPDRNPWHRRVMRALAQGRVRLAEFPVITADERVLLLDCPLRVQLAPGGEYEPAQRWLSQVARSRLGAVVDERALTLALAAIAADGQARCINLGRSAVLSASFIESASQRLAAAPEAAGRLWVDLPEGLALDCPDRVRALTRRWRPLGVMLGLEHAGDGLARLHGLMDLGLDCVRIDARFVNGIASAEAVDARRHLQGLVRLVQAVGLGVTAEGVRSPADLEVLWSLGFDAATGPAVQARLPA